MGVTHTSKGVAKGRQPPQRQGHATNQRVRGAMGVCGSKKQIQGARCLPRSAWHGTWGGRGAGAGAEERPTCTAAAWYTSVCRSFADAREGGRGRLDGCFVCEMGTFCCRCVSASGVAQVDAKEVQGRCRAGAALHTPGTVALRAWGAFFWEGAVVRCRSGAMCNRSVLAPKRRLV